MSASTTTPAPFALTPLPTITSATAPVAAVVPVVSAPAPQVALPVPELPVPQVVTAQAPLPAVAPEAVAPQVDDRQATVQSAVDAYQASLAQVAADTAAYQAAAATEAVQRATAEAYIANAEAAHRATQEKAAELQTMFNAYQAGAPQTVAPQAVAPQAVVPQAVAPQAVAPQAVAPQAVANAPLATRILVDAYVNQLVQPFRQGLSQPGMTVHALNSWLESGGMFSTEQIGRIRKAYSPDPDSTNEVSDFIDDIIMVLRSSFDDGRVTSPWVILRQVQTIPQAAQMFGIPQSTTTLPVTVICGPNIYNHQFTEDQVFGILLYPGELPCQLCMYHQPIARDFLLNLPTNYQEGYVLLSVGDQNYLGHDASLLSGYFTGAEWSGKTRADVLPQLKVSVVKAGQLVPVTVG